MTADAASPRLAFANPDPLYDPTPNGYSHVAVVETGARLAFIAGQGGETADGALSPDFGDQVRQALANLDAALRAVGAAPGRVAKLTTYVVDHDEAKLALLTRELERIFGAPYPAQTLAPVPRLALDGMLFEVDAVAVLD